MCTFGRHVRTQIITHTNTQKHIPTYAHTPVVTRPEALVGLTLHLPLLPVLVALLLAAVVVVMAQRPSPPVLTVH